MAVSYKKLWHLLIDRNMKKKDLQREAALTSYAMSKLGRDEAVTTDILAKICRSLDCTVDDIMEVLPENKTESGK
jgi:putative transcriptional regulator